ncbi:MAG: tetratricopeptide (TPR) repeat protein [Bradymonadia bacterium]|jgi:tetratricopeptide (TPR) repeat protein
MFRTLASAAVLCATLTAQAQDAPVDAKVLPLDDAECEPKDPTTAEVNVREAVRLAKQKRFADALPLFRMAVRLDGCAPEHYLLLARGLARLDKWDESRENYEQVVRRFPQSPEAALAKRELSELEVARLEAGTPQADVAGTKAVAPAATSTTDWVGYGLMGAGAVSLVLGAVYALDAQSADDDLQVAAIQPDRARYDALVDQRDSGGSLAWTFYGLGSALIVGGAIVAFVLDDAPPTKKSATGLAAYGTGRDFGLTWAGSF